MLTVGIVALLQPDYTRCCLEQVVTSTLARTNKLDVVIVLNGATLEVTNVVREYEDKCSFIRVIVNPENIGYAAACNQIVEQTHTDYVCFLHNDVIVSSRTFELLVNKAEQLSNEVAGILPLTNYANEHFPCIASMREKFMEVKPSNKERVTQEQLSLLLKELYGDFEEFSLSVESENKEEPVVFADEISSYCCLFRKASLNRIGKFKNEFKARGYEDKEFWLRFCEKGYQLAVCRIAFVHHHGNLTTDGEGFSYPEIMASEGKTYQRFFEIHKSVKKRYKPSSTQPVLHLSSAYRHIAKEVKKEGKKRLLFFGSHYPPENAGGAELSAHETHVQLQNFGIDVCAFTIRNRKHGKFEVLDSFNHQGVHVLQVPERTGEELEQKLKLIVEEFEPQVVLTHTIFAYYALKLLSDEFPHIKKVFFFRHQTDITDGRLASLLRRDGGVRVISNSKWMQSVLFERCRRDSELVKPIVTPKSCIVPKKELKRFSVTIGNGVLSKGIKELLEVARLLPEIQFDVWGTLDPSISRTMIPRNVVEKGWSNQLTDLYRDAKVVINLSQDPEPFGRTLIEAMYNRIPVIAHNEGGPKEIVEKGGVLVSDTNELVDTIAKIYNNDEYYEGLCEGTQSDLEKYNPFRENEKLIRIILDAFGTSVYPEYVF